MRLQVAPADSQSEPLMELWEDCVEGRHVDLNYPQFALSDDSEMNLHPEVNVPKKVGFFCARACVWVHQYLAVRRNHEFRPNSRLMFDFA